ncbi:MAG TPA: serine/threonine-protein kinase [Polyangiaceae bacterium]
MVAAPPAGSLVVGRYALYGKIASGGMATVYFGRMVGAAGFMRTVAIKRLHPHLAEEPDFVSMMVDEARLVARVQHPNVAQIIDVVNEGGELIIVMDYVAGEALSRLLRAESQRNHHVPPAIASAVMGGVLHGLHAAHTAKSEHGDPLGIVHRDVSPHNIMVGVDGLARVIDFGVAKAAGRIQTTRGGVVKGKLPYMAPEQLGGADVSRHADVYAAGVVLWELLTGRRLFRADDDIKLFSAVLAGASEPPSRWAPSVPRALDDVVMRALARDPATRFGTAREMADALGHAVAPALASDVGAWVEDAAKQVLDERSALLASIESSSSVPARPPPPPPPPSPTPDDLPTIVSQSASLSIESPQVAGRPSMSPPRAAAWIAGTVVVAVFAGLIVALGLRASSRSAPAAAAASFPPTPSAPVVVAPPDSAPAASVTPIASASSSPSATPTAPGTPPPPARTTRPTPAPPHPVVAPARPPGPARPAGSVIYSTPD